MAPLLRAVLDDPEWPVRAQAAAALLELPADGATLDALAALRRQRNRWQRGLMESLVAHRRMFLNPRYGVIGLFAMPYFVLFEMLGPAIELSGYLVVTAAAAGGLLDRRFMLLFFTVAFLTGVFLSVASVLLEELSFHRYRGSRDLARILGYSLLEPVCYKPLMACWRTCGIVDYVRQRKEWGEQSRRGFVWREGPGLPGPPKPRPPLPRQATGVTREGLTGP